MIKDYWKLTDEEYEFIKGEVVHLFIKYKIKCIPVSGFEIASKMGITLIAYSGLSRKKLRAALAASEDGFFAEDNGQEYIFYNDIDISYERQNWTLLHEIGHIVLDHTGHGEHEEYEANFFAKYAIAPPILVYKIDAQCPDDIYCFFDISFEAACYAYKYYKKWFARLQSGVHLAEYEQLLLALYRKTA